jgi:hypothetical protein
MRKQRFEGEGNGEGDGIATMGMSLIMEAAPFQWFFGRSCRNPPRAVFGHGRQPRAAWAAAERVFEVKGKHMMRKIGFGV